MKFFCASHYEENLCKLFKINDRPVRRKEEPGFDNIILFLPSTVKCEPVKITFFIELAGDDVHHFLGSKNSLIRLQKVITLG